MSISKVLTPELCFLEIINCVLKNKNTNVDNGYTLASNSVRYSKLRNFNNPYVYDGEIQVSEGIVLCYYFSHRRSCISLQSQKQVGNNKMQEYLGKYVQSLFCGHKIDAFIHGLNQ